jgi:multidrug transporter EmrE-like cation transporter
MGRAAHLTSLVAGLALVALGILLLLDAHRSIHLGFAYTAPAVVAAVGAVLIASGLEARGRARS